MRIWTLLLSVVVVTLCLNEATDGQLRGLLDDSEGTTRQVANQVQARTADNDPVRPRANAAGPLVPLQRHPHASPEQIKGVTWASAADIDRLARQLKSLAAGTTDQLRGLQQALETTQEQIKKHSQDNAKGIDNLAEQVKSLAEKTDGQLRGLQHAVEAHRTQSVNQSKAEVARLNAVTDQLKQLAEKTDGQLRGLIHDAEATHKHLQYVTKVVAANGKELAALKKLLGSFAERTDGQIRGLKHDLEALREQSANESSAKRNPEN